LAEILLNFSSLKQSLSFLPLKKKIIITIGNSHSFTSKEKIKVKNHGHVQRVFFMCQCLVKKPF